MTAQLDGSTALVTGGNSGIGRAIALDLAAHGAHVIVSGRDAARAEEVVAAVRENGGKADFLTTGLADEASARELARRATELGGGHIDINVKAPFFLVSALAPQMAERGKGAIDSATLSTSWPPPRRTAALGCPRRSRPR